MRYAILPVLAFSALLSADSLPSAAKAASALGTPVKVDSAVQVGQMDHVHVRAVDFVGDPGIGSDQLRRSLRALKARRIAPGWRLLAKYNPQAVDADLARLRSLYLSKGYFDAAARVDHTDIRGKNAEITFFVRSGPLYETRQSIPQLCSSLFAQRRAAERRGILDFSARLHVQPLGNGSNQFDLTTLIERGPSYRIGRIQFAGNRHYSDALLRRNLLLDEGQLLDEEALRKSIARFNQTGLFEPANASNVVIRSNPATGIAEVTVHLTERKSGRWNLSGPVGPASFAGPLVGSISSYLPPWGRGVFELSTYSVSLSLIAFAHPLVPALSLLPKGSLIPVLALSRPYTPGEGWKSGFAIVPQLGWRASALIYSTAQVQQRLLPKLSADRAPDLPVAVDSPNREGTMFCEAPQPRLLPLRTAASLSLRFLSAFTGL